MKLFICGLKLKEMWNVGGEPYEEEKLRSKNMFDAEKEPRRTFQMES